MKFTSFPFLALAAALLFFSACSTSSKYGDRSEKYSRARSKSNNNSPYENSNKSYSYKKKSESTRPRNEQIVKEEFKEKVSFSAVESAKRNDVVVTAEQYIGLPYKVSGKTPAEGFDCSGFTNFVFNENGYFIKGPSQELGNMGVLKQQNELKPGDLVFFGKDNKINHVGIVTKNSLSQTHFIHSSTSQGIKIDEINNSEYWKSRYLFGRDLLTDLLSKKVAVNY